jgi:hypothetical protein
MEEQRKHAILFAATLLCARKLIESIESGNLTHRPLTSARNIILSGSLGRVP